MIFTHSHIDHFGGIEAVLRGAGARAGRRCASSRRAASSRRRPARTCSRASAMGRRASSCTACGCRASARGHVDTGLGKAPARGTIGIAEPTDADRSHAAGDGRSTACASSSSTRRTPRRRPSSPSICPTRRPAAAPRSSRTRCTISTRCAARRCATRCAGAATSTRRSSASATPRSCSRATTGRCGATQRVVDYLKKQRDIYRYIHDQTLRLANAGATPQEIAEELELPASLAQRLRGPRLLRHAAPQREGGLPVLLRLVRRQSREPRPAAARRGGDALRRGDGRRRARCSARRSAAFDARRLSLGRDAAEPRRLRRSRATPRRASCSRAPTISSATARSRARGATST